MMGRASGPECGWEAAAPVEPRQFCERRTRSAVWSGATADPGNGS